MNGLQEACESFIIYKVVYRHFSENRVQSFYQTAKDQRTGLILPILN